MTLVPVQLLSPADVRLLGENVRHQLRHERCELGAVNRSLQVIDEEVDRLRRQAGHRWVKRLPAERRATATSRPS